MGVVSKEPHPYDFGSFDHDGIKIFWKINYRDKHDSAIDSKDPTDPTDPNQTMRVFTVILASEY